MSFAHLRSEYDQQGFVVVRQFLPPADFAKRKRELDRDTREVLPGL